MKLSHKAKYLQFASTSTQVKIYKRICLVQPHFQTNKNLRNTKQNAAKPVVGISV